MSGETSRRTLLRGAARSVPTDNARRDVRWVHYARSEHAKGLWEDRGGR